MIKISQLGSGLRLVTESMNDVASASVGVWVGTGSRDEAPAQSGISHFLEHLLFKGTATRTARQIAEAVDAVGGDMNAYTTKEYTTFYVRALSEHLDLGLDILCDILREPALRPHEVDAERQVILEEVLMHRDEPADVVQERFSEIMFPEHALGREVLGLPRRSSAASPAGPAARRLRGRRRRPPRCRCAWSVARPSRLRSCWGCARRSGGLRNGTTWPC